LIVALWLIRYLNFCKSSQNKYLQIAQSDQVIIMHAVNDVQEIYNIVTLH